MFLRKNLHIFSISWFHTKSMSSIMHPYPWITPTPLGIKSTKSCFQLNHILYLSRLKTYHAFVQKKKKTYHASKFNTMSKFCPTNLLCMVLNCDYCNIIYINVLASNIIIYINYLITKISHVFNSKDLTWW